MWIIKAKKKIRVIKSCKSFSHFSDAESLLSIIQTHLSRLWKGGTELKKKKKALLTSIRVTEQKKTQPAFQLSSTEAGKHLSRWALLQLLILKDSENRKFGCNLITFAATSVFDSVLDPFTQVWEHMLGWLLLHSHKEM